MRRLAIVAGFGLLVAAGSFIALRALSGSSTPRPLVVSRATVERERLGYWRVQPAARHPGLPPRLKHAVTEALSGGGVQLIGAGTDRTPSPAPAIDLAVSEPAGFLHDHLGGIARATRGFEAASIRIVDGDGARVLEWRETNRGGSLFVRPSLEGCSPIVALGWQHVPTCPSS